MDFKDLETQGRVRLCYWGYAEGTSDIQVKRHAHTYYQANFTLRGSCVVKTGEGTFLLHPNDLMFIAPGVEHELRYPEPCLSCCCKFEVVMPGLPKVLYVPADEFTEGVIQTTKIIMETTFLKRFFGVPEGTIVMPQDHYQCMMEYYLTGLLKTLRHKQPQNGLPQRIMTILEKDPKAFFTVEEAAAACHYSRNHFSLLVKQATGVTAKAFLNELRLKNAQRLLRFSGQTIGEIARQMGFSNQFHFSDFFKRMTGMSPLQYRKKILREEAEFFEPRTR